MRFYNLSISDAATGLIWKPTASGLGFEKTSGGTTFSSLLNGYTNPGALHIEFEFVSFPFAAFQAQAAIKIWGVGLGMISQAANLNGANFKLFAGMALGLPLANPAQAGLIAQGSIFQAYGNWEGTNQTLDLICYPNTVRQISMTWKKGTQLSAALVSALQPAFSGYTISSNISSNLTAPSDQNGLYDSLADFADFVSQKSMQIGIPIYGSSYAGVQITVQGSTIYLTDQQGAVVGTSKQLAFQDLIGQPTWIGPQQISFKTVLRADIQVSQNISFPIGVTTPYVLTSQAAANYPNAAASNKTAFQGEFNVTEVHHFASFRQPQAESWNTTFTAVPIN